MKSKCSFCDNTDQTAATQSNNSKRHLKVIDRLKHSRLKRIIRREFVLYADSTEMLEKAQKLLRPLPQGCRFEKLTNENKDLYKCTIGDVDKMLQVEGDVWVVVKNDNEIIAYCFGTYRGKNSLFFKVRNCDFEIIETKVDKRFRRNGIALHLTYHTIKNLNLEDAKNKKAATVIHPDNLPSLKLHELIGFKKTRKILFLHFRWKSGSHYTFINIPRYNI